MTRQILASLLPPRDNSCTRHTWIYYHSFRVRQCHDCSRQEALWADFGLGNTRTDENEHTEHRTRGAGATAPGDEQDPGHD